MYVGKFGFEFFGDSVGFATATIRFRCGRCCGGGKFSTVGCLDIDSVGCAICVL